MSVIQAVMKGILQLHVCISNTSLFIYVRTLAALQREAVNSELETSPWPKLKPTIFTFIDTFFSRSAAPLEQLACFPPQQSDHGSVMLS